MAQDDDDVMIIEEKLNDKIGSVVGEPTPKGGRRKSDSKKIITPDPPKKSPKEIAEQKKEEGNKLYKQGNFVEAARLYTEAIELYPQPSFFTNRSQCFIKSRRYSDAAKDAEAAVIHDKTFVKGYLKQAKCYILLGKLEDARNALESAQQLEKASGSNASEKEIKGDQETIRKIEKYMKDIDNLWMKKDWRAVIYYCGQILDLSPELKDYAVKKAHAMVYHNQVAEALNSVVDVLRLDSKNVDALFVRGLALFYSDQVDKASDHFKQALTLAPDHNNSMCYFKKIKVLKQKKEEASSLLKEGKVKEALNLYQEALKVEPENSLVNARLHFNVSVCYGKLNEHKLSLVSCNEAIALDPSYEKALMKKIQLLMSVEKFEEAAREAESLHKKMKTTISKALLDEAKSALKKSKHKDYYKILGVGRTASEEEIKKAYKKMAMVHHPDRHSNATEDEKSEHEKKFKDLGEAYTVLSDRNKRMRYDNGQDIEGIVGPNDQNGFPSGFDPNEIFQAFFSGAGGGFGGSGASFSFGGGGGGGRSRGGHPFAGFQM